MTKHDVQLKFYKARPIPFVLRKKMRQEIIRLIKENILTPVDYSEWGIPIIPVMKPNGTVRIFKDFKTSLDPALEADRYPLPQIDYWFAKLQGDVTLSEIDLEHAYQQI